MGDGSEIDSTRRHNEELRWLLPAATRGGRLFAPHAVTLHGFWKVTREKVENKTKNIIIREVMTRQFCPWFLRLASVTPPIN